MAAEPKPSAATETNVTSVLRNIIHSYISLRASDECKMKRTNEQKVFRKANYKGFSF
jgi:hypothetical protein